MMSSAVTAQRKKLLERCLAGTVLFNGLPPRDIARIVPLIRERTFRRGERIIAESTHGKDIYIVLSGRVVTYLSDRRKRKIVGYQTAGDVLGEVGFFTGHRSATCECLEDTVVGLLRHRDFHSFVTGNITVAFNIIELLARRLISANREISNLSFKPVLERMSAVLLENANDRGEIALTVTALAERIGANRETASRVVSELQKLNCISRGASGRLTVVNPARLREIAGA